MAQVQTRLQSPTRRMHVLLTCFLQLVGVIQAWAADFLVTPLDGPGASATEIHSSSNTGQLVGTFWGGRGAHGLLCTPPLDAPCSHPYLSALDLWFNGFKAVSTQIQSLTTGGQMAGFFVDVKGANHGFLCAGFPANPDCHQVDVAIDSVVMANTLILGIDEQGQFVGSYRDSRTRIHGFLFTSGSLIRIDVPDSRATVVSGVATASGTAPTTIVGFFVDAKFGTHGFLCQLPVSQNCFTIFDVTLNGVPQAMTQTAGMNKTQIVGSFLDNAGNAHGFVCQLPLHPECFIQVDALHGVNTQVLGINDRGQLVGHYRDQSGRQRGFITLGLSEFSVGRTPSGVGQATLLSSEATPPPVVIPPSM